MEKANVKVIGGKDFKLIYKLSNLSVSDIQNTK